MAARAQTPSAPYPPKSPFHQQRDALLSEIAISFEQVLQNINKLNRSLEGVIAVGNEFGAVEALWSQFEGVMAKDGKADGGDAAEGKDGHGGEEDGEEEEEEEGETVVEEKGRER